MTRNRILSQAVDQCLKELYKFVYPRISWKNFIKENKEYSDKYKVWEEYSRARNRKKENPEEWNKIKSSFPDWWENASITECIGPRPFEFYYLPKEIMKDICDSYIYAYKLDSNQELINTIEILKNYCKEPIIDKYIEGELREDGTRWPGHRGYDNPDNLEKELYKLLREKAGFSITDGAIENLSKEVQNKFFEFLDMAGNFYNWGMDLNSFNMSVYLGPSPNSNKEAVIKNWKKFRDKDIKISDKKIKKEYYGDDE